MPVLELTFIRTARVTTSLRPSVVAPFDGVVTKRYADTGALVQAGTSSSTQAMPVVRVAETDVCWLILPVPESAVPQVHLGTTVQVRVQALNRTFAMADLRRLPPGTLPPVVLKFDGSSLPVCQITLKGQGLNETQLRDLGQYTVRSQIANVPAAPSRSPSAGAIARSFP